MTTKYSINYRPNANPKGYYLPPSIMLRRDMKLASPISLSVIIELEEGTDPAVVEAQLAADKCIWSFKQVTL
jgi:hypothetical protein